MTTKKTKETRPIGLRLPVEWLKDLEEIAEEEGGRSINSIIRQAVKEYMIRRGKQ